MSIRDLTLKVDVLGLDKVKALVDLLNKHRDDLPSELNDSLEELASSALNNVTAVINNVAIDAASNIDGKSYLVGDKGPELHNGELVRVADDICSILQEMSEIADSEGLGAKGEDELFCYLNKHYGEDLPKDMATVVIEMASICYSEGLQAGGTEEVMNYIANRFPELTQEYDWLPWSDWL